MRASFLFLGFLSLFSSLLCKKGNGDDSALLFRVFFFFAHVQNRYLVLFRFSFFQTRQDSL